jgi:hypothetical protein
MLTSLKMNQIVDKKENDTIEEIKYYIDSFNDRELSYEEDLKTIIYLKLKLNKTEVKSNLIKSYQEKFYSVYERFYLTLI